MAILYVDKLNTGSTLGMALKPSTIEYNKQILVLKNLRIVSSEGAASEFTFTEYYTAGRYVCTIMTDIDKAKGMAFLDLKNDIKLAVEMIKNFENQIAKDLFMKTFEVVSKTYKEHYNEFTLVLGNPPSSSSN